ncbi:MAG TPA: hypothetical protein VLJ79_14795 [Candidatus Binatia bacterium]|nr:hypothetical protein [Candidatus Binatia bacterium]
MRALIGIAVLLLFGCTAKSVLPVAETMPPIVLATLGDAGIKDVRHLYRAAVCGQLPADYPDCDELILRFPGETGSGASSVQTDIANRYRIGFVPGFFSDCLNGTFYPFTDVIADLTGLGFVVHDLPTFGRASSAANAERLGKQLAQLSPDPKPFIMVVYSKGLPDFLELLLRYPQTAQHIAAIISIAGAANGSPVADDLYEFYRDWLAGLPMPGCDRGTGEEVRDLRRDVRLEWWTKHRSAITVPIFSVVAVPKADRVSPILKQAYTKLAGIDPRNDGLLLWYDAVVSRGYLLGYVNADHLAIVVPASQQVPAFSFLFTDNVPRTVLVRAAIEVVVQTLETVR